jgi:hypothetical protein
MGFDTEWCRLVQVRERLVEGGDARAFEGAADIVEVVSHEHGGHIHTTCTPTGDHHHPQPGASAMSLIRTQLLTTANDPTSPPDRAIVSNAIRERGQ